jgi:hypothetical protein
MTKALGCRRRLRLDSPSVSMKERSIGSPPVAGRTREGKAVAVRSGISRKFSVIFKTFNICIRMPSCVAS